MWRLVLLLLKGCTCRIRGGHSRAGANCDLTRGAMRIAIVILAIANIAADTLNVLLVRPAILRGAAVGGMIIHGNSLPYLYFVDPQGAYGYSMSDPRRFIHIT